VSRAVCSQQLSNLSWLKSHLFGQRYASSWQFLGHLPLVLSLTLLPQYQGLDEGTAK